MAEILIEKPRLGPIVGHTTDTTSRLWIRGGDPEQGPTLSPDHRTIGVLCVLQGQPLEGCMAYFRLKRENDRTGVFELGRDVTLSVGSGAQLAEPGTMIIDSSRSLTPTTHYRVALGVLVIEDNNSLVDYVSDERVAAMLPPLGPSIRYKLLALGEDAVAEFRTFPARGEAASKTSFIFGSCRFPGISGAGKSADAIAGPIYANAKDPDCRFMLMAGDQIYADYPTANEQASTAPGFRSCYHNAFGYAQMRRLLRSCPTYMTLDDHEITNDWSSDRRNKKADKALLDVALEAYRIYQRSHGPQTFGKHHYFSFDCGEIPFFVLDTRTYRREHDEDSLNDNHLLGPPSLSPSAQPGQLDALLRWLELQGTRGDVPKFIVSSNTFVPNRRDERRGPLPDNVPNRIVDEEALLSKKRRKAILASDSWPAYPRTRRAILDLILQREIRNVVFLCGDIHCSAFAEMTLRAANGREVKAWSITSSPLHWPIPVANGTPSGYVRDSSALTDDDKDDKQADTFPLSDGATMDYVASCMTDEDNFCRVTIAHDDREYLLTAEFFGSDGKVITSTAMDGEKHKFAVTAALT
jgi:alkaline phosphatase D